MIDDVVGDFMRGFRDTFLKLFLTQSLCRVVSTVVRLLGCWAFFFFVGVWEY